MWISEKELITFYKYSIIINMYNSSQICGYIAVICMYTFGQIFNTLTESSDSACNSHYIFLYRIMGVVSGDPSTAFSSATAIAMSSTESYESNCVLLHARFRLQLCAENSSKAARKSKVAKPYCSPNGIQSYSSPWWL